MTPLEIEEYARQRYNAVGDTFFTESEVMRSIYRACVEIAREALCIEKLFTASTVASQQEYDWPENAISIRRVTYDGNRIDPISFDEDDSMSFSGTAVIVTGRPSHYSSWNEAIYLRPIPDEVKTLKIWAFVEPQTIGRTSSLEVPTQFHVGIADAVLRDMCEKDKQFDSAKYYDEKWQKTVLDAKRWGQKSKRAARFASVKDEESLPRTTLGMV